MLSFKANCWWRKMDARHWAITLAHFDLFVLYPEVIKLFPCSTQLSTKFILLINVKMPTIVGILTFISMINTSSERLNARNFFICRYFSFYEQSKFHAQLSWAWKKFYNLGARPDLGLHCLTEMLLKYFSRWGNRWHLVWLAF